MNDADRTHQTADEPADSAPRLGKPTEIARFQLRKVLLAVMPVAILLFVVVLAIRYVGMDSLMEALTRPTLAPATGQVLYRGEPLRNGSVRTQPTGQGLSAFGWTDDEGRFSLKTDIQGVLEEGATVGEHRVTVSAYQPIAAAAAPPLLTPPAYASLESSPLRITIGRNTAQNDFQLVLEGEPPSRPTRPTSAKAPNQPKAEGDVDVER